MLKLRISALLLTFAALIGGGQALQADNVTLQQDSNGGWYAVIPTNEGISPRAVNTLTLQDANLPSFKVYDHNGPNGTSYSKGDGALVITAPTGYVLQVTGTLTTDLTDYFYVFNGYQVLNFDQSINGVYQSSSWGEAIDLGTIISSGNVISLQFKSDYGSTKYDGLDLTVTLIDQTPHSISVVNTVGGSVSPSLTSAAVNTDITLTPSPDSGYRMTDIRVADGLGSDIAVDWSGSFSNNATFRMSSSNVLVTPLFTNNLTAEGGLFVNMPKTGTVDITASQLSGVYSFKVYDDGGRDGDYSQGCDGILTLTAPSGYVLKLEGKVRTSSKENAFSAYEGIGTIGTALVDGVQSTAGGSRNVSATSTGQSLTLRFVTSDTQAVFSGLDLTVRVYDPNHTYAISKGSIIDGGDISFKVGSSVVNSAHPGRLVTVSATIPSAYDFDGINVTYQSSNKTLTLEKTSDNEAKFTMPGEAVTVTPIFTHVPDAVTYIDADGNEASCTRYTEVESSNGNVEISSQWAVVKGNVTIHGTLNLTNTGCNLILCDNATLTISTSYNGINATDLNIYGQSAGTGTLNVTSSTLQAINAASITINGGNITAQSNSSIAISGAKGVTINGGNVSATGNKGIYAPNGNITLGWQKPTDSITASNYSSIYYRVQIKDGQAMTDGTDIYIGKQEPLSDGSYAIDGKTLQPAVKITLPTGVTATGTIMHGGDSYAQPGATVTLAAASGYIASDYASTDVNITESDGVYSFEVPAYDVTISATCTAADTFVIPANQAALNGVTKFWATFYHPLGNYQLPDGAMALTMDSNKQLYVVGNGNIVPAATAVVIMADASALDANGKLVLTETTETATPVDGNKLEGTSVATATTNLVSGTQKVYVLSKVGEDFGFFQFEGTLNANKAYFIDD